MEEKLKLMTRESGKNCFFSARNDTVKQEECYGKFTDTSDVTISVLPLVRLLIVMERNWRKHFRLPSIDINYIEETVSKEQQDEGTWRENLSGIV